MFKRLYNCHYFLMIELYNSQSGTADYFIACVWPFNCLFSIIFTSNQLHFTI
jgi:hypothetical protein